MALFATHLSRRVRLATIKVYVSAVAFLHHAMGLRSPTSSNPTLRLVYRGLKRRNVFPSSQRLPITPCILTQFIHSLQKDPSLHHKDRAMLKAASLLAFFGFLRVGEFSSAPLGPGPIRRGDVTICRHQAKVVIRRSKADQWGHGACIVVGCSRSQLCPVEALEYYFHLNPRQPASSPLFSLSSGASLTSQFFRRICRRHFSKIGLNPALYNTHSFRIGAATAAAKAGLPTATIRDLGRWRSNACYAYIRAQPTHPAAAAAMSTSEDTQICAR